MSGAEEGERKALKWLGGPHMVIERQRRRWSQRKAAEHFGINQASYSRWETGNNNPGDWQVPAVAEYLGVTEGLVHNLIHAVNAPEDSNAAVGAVLADYQRHKEWVMDSITELVENFMSMSSRVEYLTAKVEGLESKLGPPEFTTDVPPDR